jgi:AcrR family transcriptional regulator
MVLCVSEQQAIRIEQSPRGMPRHEVARIQRERLLDAITSVVAAVGYEETSVERILVQAGVSRRTFYELFSDKEDCFLAAYEEAMRRALRIVTEAYIECETPELRIEAALEAFLRFCSENPQLARTCIVEVFAAGPRARERRTRFLEQLAALLEHALSELRGDQALDRLAAQALVGGVHEVIYAPIDQGDTAALPAMAAEIVVSQIAPMAELGR